MFDISFLFLLLGSLFFYIYIITLENKYHDCRRGEATSRRTRVRGTRSVDCGGDSVARGGELSRNFTCHTAHTLANVVEHVTQRARTHLAETPDTHRTYAYGVGHTQLDSPAVLLPRESDRRERWRRSNGCASRTRRRRRISRYAETSPSRR